MRDNINFQHAHIYDLCKATIIARGGKGHNLACALQFIENKSCFLSRAVHASTRFSKFFSRWLLKCKSYLNFTKLTRALEESLNRYYTVET